MFKLGNDLLPLALSTEFLAGKIYRQYPRGPGAAQHFLIPGADIRVLRIGVIIDFGRADKIADVTFREVEGDHGGEHGGVVASLFVLDLVLEENGHAGGLDVLGGVQQLLQTRHAQCHVLVSHTCQVECVQRHLGCRLADGLCGNRADSLPCWR